jgi:hypothetical protein
LIVQDDVLALGNRHAPATVIGSALPGRLSHLVNSLS